MAKRDIVVIGASAGGVYALRDLAAALPPDFKATIFVVLHVSPHSPSYLPDILNNAGPLKATHPTDGEPFQRGHIYVAPPTTTCCWNMTGSSSRKARKKTAFARPSTPCFGRRLTRTAPA